MPIPSRWFAIGTTAVVCLTALAYAPALRGPQLFDDPSALQNNPSIRQLWPIGIPLHPPLNTPVAGRPVVNYSLALNYWFNRVVGVDQSADPGGPSKTVSYHALNLIIHIACGLLLLGIVRRTLRNDRMAEYWRQQADGIALLVAAFWLLHPLQTEAVDYIVQRTELLVGFCYLATLYCSIRAWRGSASRWFCAGTVACLLGMGSKEVMVSAPLMIVLYDRAFHANSWREVGNAQRGRRWFYFALAATLLLLAGIVANNPRGASVGFNSGMHWYDYLHTQGWAISHYLRLVFVPNSLLFDYGYGAVTRWKGVPGLLLLAALGTLTVLAWIRADRWGWLGFLGAWFFLILAPSSSVVPVYTEPIAERRMYLPLAAVIVLFVAAADAALRYAARRSATANRRSSLQRAATCAAVVLALGLGALTARRSALYADPEAIWLDVTAKAPDNPRAWNSLGAALAHLPVPQPQEAEVLYRKAVALDSSYTDGLLNLAMSEFARHDNAEAERGFRRALAVDSTSHFALGGLGTMLLDRGDTVAALPLMERFAAGGAGASFLGTMSDVYFAEGRVDEGTSTLRRAIQQDPARTDLMVQLAANLIQAKHPDQAEPYLLEALKREPDSGEELMLLSLADAALGRTAEAVAHAARAVQFAGNNERVDFLAGRAMEQVHRDDLAEDFLQRAVALGPNHANVIAELADVKEDLGKKAEAIVLFRRALQLDPKSAAARAGLARLR